MDISSVFVGSFVHAPLYGEIEVVTGAVVAVGSDGRIVRVISNKMESIDNRRSADVLNMLGISLEIADSVRVVWLDKGQFLCPGFVDTHIHAPQFSFSGIATDRPLMQWLDHYMTPSEEAMADTDNARAQYDQVVKTTMKHGTCTALYFATIHLPATCALADLAASHGQRAYVGLVAMDQHSRPDYVSTTEEALSNTESFIQYCRDKFGTTGLIHPVVTPRFIPMCSDKLLTGLGRLAAKHDVHVQSHISESKDEVAFVHSLHGEAARDSEIFDRHGLLTSKAVMAHGVLLDDHDLNILSHRGTAVSHCPLSNFFFANGLLQSKKLVEKGVKLGLGTDVAGGYSPSMLQSIRHAVVMSKVAGWDEGAGGPDANEINYKHAFWMATAGGAAALGAPVGIIREGLEFDCLVVDCTEIDTYNAMDSLEDTFQKFMNLGDDRHIKQVWVAGKQRR